MRLSEFLKRTGNNIAIFCQTVFGDNPDQYVEVTDDEALLAAAVTGNLPRNVAAEIIKASRDMDENGKLFSKTIDMSIDLGMDGNVQNTTSAAERSTSYRDSEAMRSLRNRRIDISANNLPNSPREVGGEERTKVGH